MTEQTKAGKMVRDMSKRGVQFSALLVGAEKADRFDAVLAVWQDAVNLAHYGHSGYTHSADQCRGTFGAKYARLDIGGSGAFMVETESGLIYGIMGYGKVDKKKISGNIYDPNFDGAVLVRDRFRRGRFTNNPDGSIQYPRHGEKL